jgi:hypothetical protein
MVTRQLVRSRVVSRAVPFSRPVRPRRRARTAVECGIREIEASETTCVPGAIDGGSASTIDTIEESRRAAGVSGGRRE